MNTEISEILSAPSKVYEIAEKTVNNIALTSEEKDAVKSMDAWAREVGKTGHDKDHEISAFITRTVNEQLYNAPDYILDQIFNRGSIGEFDDVEYERAVKNTLVAYDAAKGGNVPRSFLNFKAVAPKWFHKQVETDLSMADLRKNGWKSIAQLTTFATEALQNKMFNEVFAGISAAITGGDQMITATGTAPTLADIDALTLYLMDHTEDGTQMIVTRNQYAKAIRRMEGFAQYMSDDMKNEYNRYGIVPSIDGVMVAGISGAKTTGDGASLFPDKLIFGAAGKLGNLDMRGEIRTYQTEDTNDESIHIKVTGFEFGYALPRIDLAAKIVLG